MPAGKDALADGSMRVSYYQIEKVAITGYFIVYFKYGVLQTFG